MNTENSSKINIDTFNLANEEEAVQFYDQRYSKDWTTTHAKGYMEGWPIEKKQRIAELIKELNLPSTGEALDFGCGIGEFTEVLKQCLPGWNIYGVDISPNAVDDAKKLYSDCGFFVLSDLRGMNKKFDFLFSHHVLEHVDDIDKTWSEMDRYLNEKGSVLHVLPCGNEGSFEHYLCLLRKDGIDHNFGNRFAFEDKSHLRRLTSQQMDSHARKYDLKPVFGYYANQLYGSLDWISLLSPGLILDLTSPHKGKNIISKCQLMFFCGLFQGLKILRFPANAIEHKKGIMKSHKYYSLFIILMLFYPFSKLLNVCLRSMSDWEWKNRRNKKNGSEMYLYYKRTHML